MSPYLVSTYAVSTSQSNLDAGGAVKLPCHDIAVALTVCYAEIWSFKIRLKLLTLQGGRIRGVGDGQRLLHRIDITQRRFLLTGHRHKTPPSGTATGQPIRTATAGR